MQLKQLVHFTGTLAGRITDETVKPTNVLYRTLKALSKIQLGT